jgi:hypothetical protein
VSRSEVMEVADWMFRWEILRVVEGRDEDIGPGLSSISPASRSRQKAIIEVLLVIEKLHFGVNDELHKKKLTGKESRHLQMEEYGKG